MSDQSAASSDISRERLIRRRIEAITLLDETDRPRSERIRDAIQALGLSQEQIADLTGIRREKINMAVNSHHTLNRIEHLIRTISDEELPGT